MGWHQPFHPMRRLHTIVYLKQGDDRVTRTQCVGEIDAVIQNLQRVKALVRQNKKKQAIDGIADSLSSLGRALVCINRLEARKYRCSARIGNSSLQVVSSQPRNTNNQCIRLINLAIMRLKISRRLVQQNRFEEAENVIFSIITGRVLRCINNLPK